MLSNLIFVSLWSSLTYEYTKMISIAVAKEGTPSHSLVSLSSNYITIDQCPAMDQIKLDKLHLSWLLTNCLQQPKLPGGA